LRPECDRAYVSEDADDATGDDTEIRRLDQRTVERIAAGEVVERPASVVKELVENSVDADADRVDVSVSAGGTEGIVVADDGIGMTEADVRAAVREHTTSKIDDIADLEGGVGTLGFRGEALHTIGAVSRTTIETRPRDGADSGTELVYEGGEVTSVRPTGCPVGTRIEVTDLFYNTPARKKYLKTEATEFSHVNRVVTQYALANPDVAVSLTHDGRETFATTGQGDLQSTVLSVYGREVAEAMVPVAADDDDDLPDGPLDGVSGLVSHPETTRSTREYVSTFVNGRYVTAGALREAVVAAYGGQLAADRYPFVVLFVDVPAGDVDVNVHPRKMEVRFDDEAAVREQVRAAVHDALVDGGLVRTRAPRGRSAPDETAVAPERSGEAESAATSGDGAPGAAVDDATSAGTEAARGPDGADGTANRRDPDDTANRRDPDDTAASRDSDDRDATAATADSDPAAGGASERGSPAGDDGWSDDDGWSPDDGWAIDPDAATAGDSDAAGPHEETAADPTLDEWAAGDDRPALSGAAEQRTLGGGDVDDETPTFETLPSMRVLGQLHDTYVVAETPEGLVLIDQHAADERVNYERLQAEFAGDTTAQALAEPVDLELTAGEAAGFAAAEDALASLGFHAERADDRTVRVTTVPAVFDETVAPERLRDVLAGAIAGGDGDRTVEAIADEFLADLACYPSITGNTSLTEGSVVDLLAALEDCADPFACPHGRPVIVAFDRESIEARFERDYPGHGGRRDA